MALKKKAGCGRHGFDAPVRERWAAGLLGVSVLACAAVVLLRLFHPFLRQGLYRGTVVDDAYIFERYASNLTAFGDIAWNAGGPPTYGPTSLLYVPTMAAMHRLLRSGPMLAVAATSMICGAAFLILLILLLERHVGASPPPAVPAGDGLRLGGTMAGRGGTEPRGDSVGGGAAVLRRGIILGLLLALSVTAFPGWRYHFQGGMDTAFAMAYLTAYTLLAKWHERSSTMVSTLLLALVGGMALAARPDLALFSLLVPASLAVSAAPGMHRRRAWTCLGLTGVLMAGEAVFFRIHFQTSVPLSFFVKGTHYYGPQIRAHNRDVPGRELAAFLRAYWYVFLTIAIGLAFNARRWLGPRGSAVDRGLLVAAALFIAYYRFAVLQIMHSYQRFYYPVAPVLIYLGAAGFAGVIARTALWRRERYRAIRSWVALGTGAAVLGALLPALVPKAIRSVSAVASGRYAEFSTERQYRAHWTTYWYGLDAFSALPDDLVIATTEVGRPAAMNPGKVIVDLSGLNETVFALHGFSPRLLFQHFDPDLIYMPNPNYAVLNQEIENAPYFRRHYELYTRDRLAGATLAVAIRRDSRHFEAMRRILRGKR